MARARSIYRQIRFTITEERGGLVSARVLVKPVDADWTMKDCVWQGRLGKRPATTHWSELLQYAAEDVLAQRLFPE
jgi:hypothetical protein